MAQRDGAAVDVDAIPVPAELASIGDGLNGEGLIGLDQIIVLDSGAGLLHQGAYRHDRGKEEIPRFAASYGIAGDACHRLETVSFCEGERCHDQCTGAIVQPWCIARGYRAAVLPKRRLELGECLGSRIPPRRLVSGYGRAA